MKKGLLFIFIFLMCGCSFAATITSAGTGTSGTPSVWTTGASWVGGVAPATTDDVVIAAGDFVTTGAITRASGTITTVSATATLTLTGALTITGATLTVNGIVEINTTGNPNVPIATWNTGSHLKILGALGGSTGASGFSQNFYHVTWNPSTQSGTLQLSMSGSLTWGGDLTIVQTGTGVFRCTSATATSLTVNGLTSMQGGIFHGTGTGGLAITQNFNGGLSLSGAASMFIVASSATCTTSVGGDLTISGTATLTKGSGVVTFQFNKNGVQNFVKTGGSISNGGSGVYTFNVNSGSTLNMGTNIFNSTGTTLTFNVLSGGGLKIGDPAGIVLASGAGNTTGNIQLTGATGTSKTFSTSASYEYNGSAAQVTGTGLPATVKNLTINNSFVTAPQVTLGQAVAVTGIFTPTLGTLATGGFLTLKSTSIANTATVGVAAAANQVTGDVTIERFIPQGFRAFRFLTPGVTTSTNIRTNWQDNGGTTGGIGTHITGSTTGANGFDATGSGTASMFTLDNGTGVWAPIAGTDGSNILQAGRGYRILIRGDRNVNLGAASAANMNVATTLKATGTLITGPVIMGYSGNGINTVGMPNLSTATVGNASYTLIGNPYYSPIDWNALTRSGVSPTYFAWDANMTGANNRGAYVSWNATTGFSNLGNSGTSFVNQYIQPGQAIFVQSTSATPVLTFAEANKNTSLTAVFRTQSQYANMSVLLFKPSEIATGKPTDGATVVFDDAFAAGIDGGDANKMVNPDENIAIVRNSTNLSIEARPKVAAYDTVYLRLWQLTAGNSYAFKINAENFTGTDAWIKDNYLNTTTAIDLANGTIVNFSTTNSVAASYAENRFNIVFRNSGALPSTFLNVSAAQKNAGIEVGWNTANETNMASYEVEESSDGTNFTKATTVAAKNAASNSYSWFDGTVINGDNYYRIRSVEKNGSSRYSNIVKVRTGGKNAEFSVYPNPVKGGVINLQMGNVEKGIYTIKLFNNLGQELVSRTISHNGGSASQTILLGNAVPQGSYRMQVMNNGTTVATKTVVVE